MSGTLFNQKTPYGLCFVALRPRNSNPNQMTPIVYMYKCKRSPEQATLTYTPEVDANGNMIEDWTNPIAKCDWRRGGEVKVLSQNEWFCILSRETRALISKDIKAFFEQSQS